MTLLADLRDARRSLTRHAGVALLSVALLSVGIGSATAVFSIVNAVWLRPLPFGDAARVATIAVDNPKRGTTGGPFSWAAFDELRRGAHGLSAISAFASERMTLTGQGDAEQLPAGRVSASFLAVLGITPAAGRGFLPEEDRAGGPQAVVIGRDFWMRRFGGDPAIVGKTLTLNGTAYTVVGALGLDLPPPLSGVDVWTTKVWDVSTFTPAQIQTGAGYLGAVARLAPGVTFRAAQAELDGVRRGYAAAHPANTDADPDSVLRLARYDAQMIAGITTPLVVLAGAVALVMLIACANVANLLLVRGASRQREWAVRLAMGASVGRVMRQLALEALFVAGAAGVAGVLLAWWALSAATTAVGALPRGADVALDSRALAFAAAAAIATSVLAMLLPALRAAATEPAGALGGGSRSVTRRRSRAGAVLVTGEVCLAVVLLVGAALLLQSVARLVRTPLGYEPSGVLTMRVSMPASRYPQPEERTQFVDRLVERARTIPGVREAAISLALPPAGNVAGPYQDADAEPRPVGERAIAMWSCVTPGYFEAMGIALLQGRAFTVRDTAAAPRVVIISRSTAEHLWRGRNPIGRRMFVGRLPEPSEVVGVVADVKNAGLDRAPMDQMYSPFAQRTWPSVSLVVRARGGDPMRLLPAVRATLRDVDPDVPPTDVRTGDAAIGDASSQAAFIAALMAVFGSVALLMAAAGLYGVIAYSVAQRAREIAVRMALGAGRRSVIELVVGESMRLCAAGIGAGGACAVAGSRFVNSMLYGITAVDPATYAGVAAVFALVALAASLLPARRALAIDPIVALRES